MEILYFTLVAAGLYFFSDWLLTRVETARGKRFEQRNVIFFVIILVLALASFKLINVLQPSAAPVAIETDNRPQTPEKPDTASP